MSLRLALLATTLACAAAQAAPPSQDELRAQRERIQDQYETARAQCRRLDGHARALCQEQARGERDIQVAEMRFEAEPTADNDQKLRLVRAEASFARAQLQCKEMDGQARRVCRADAQTVYEQAKNEAVLQREVVQQALGSENAVRERAVQAQRMAQGQYDAALRRCDALPPEGRLNCLDDAKKRFSSL